METESSDIFQYFEEGWPARIDTPKSWIPHILECHKELVALDPDYKIHQIKEKFWMLRYYFVAKNTDSYPRMQAIVYGYEARSKDWGGYEGESDE